MGLVGVMASCRSLRGHDMVATGGLGAVVAEEVMVLRLFKPNHYIFIVSSYGQFSISFELPFDQPEPPA